MQSEPAIFSLITHRDAENDNTQLIGHQDIRTLSRKTVVSHTPANYDQVQFKNPVYDVEPAELEETKADLGSGSIGDD